MSMCLGCSTNQEHLLVGAIPTIGGQTWEQEGHHCGSTQPCDHWLLPAKEPAQLRRSRRRLFRSHRFCRSEAILDQTTRETRAQGDSRADPSHLTNCFPSMFSREKAGLQRDAIRSQCSTCSRHKEKETGYEKDY